MAVDAFAEGSCGQLLSFPFCKIATQKRGLLPLSGSLFLHSHVANVLRKVSHVSRSSPPRSESLQKYLEFKLTKARTQSWSKQGPAIQQTVVFIESPKP